MENAHAFLMVHYYALIMVNYNYLFDINSKLFIHSLDRYSFRDYYCELLSILFNLGRGENKINNVDDKNDFKIMKNCKLKQTTKVLSMEMAIIIIYLLRIIQWLLISILINVFLLNNNNRILPTVNASILANIPIGSVSGTSVSLSSSASASPGSTHYSGKFEKNFSLKKYLLRNIIYFEPLAKIY